MPRNTLDVEIIGSAIGCGAQDQRTELAADWLKERGLTVALQKRGIANRFHRIVRSGSAAGPLLQALPTVATFATDLAAEVRATMAEHRFPIVVGGDHSGAIGTWSGVKGGMKGELGLIWLDAHMDSHTVETTETGAVHGMPLAALLGYGDSRLCSVAEIAPKILPKNLVLVGVRSYEAGEMELLHRLGVRVIYMNEVEARGFDACFSEALAIATRHTEGFGISLDLDGIDPEEAPAVGSPCPNGFSTRDVKKAFRLAANRDDFVALEIAEYNPMKDLAWKTYFAMIELIEAVRTPHPLRATKKVIG